MDSTVLIPLLFPMEQAFEDIGDGSCIRVLGPDGDEHVGVLHVTRLPEAGRFGAIIQFGPADAVESSAPASRGDPGFTHTGHSGRPMHRLTLEELHGIERTGDAGVPFALALLPPS